VKVDEQVLARRLLMDDQPERVSLHRKTEVWKRVLSLPADLADAFLQDLDVAIEARLQVFEREAALKVRC
jgi:hypothetical protein